MARSSLKNIFRLVEEAQKEIPIEQSFLSDLERSIEIDDKKNSRKPSETYKPSSMTCMRNMYYQRTGAEQDEGDSSYMLVNICNSGSDIHERIQKAVCGMLENGMDCEYVDVAEYVKSRELNDIEIVSKQGMETKLFHKKWKVSFLCDGIIKYRGRYYILELKTENANKFMMRKGVDPKHYMQGTAYATMLEIDKVIFVYISRDMLNMKSFMFEPTMDMEYKFVNQIESCEHFVEAGEVPPKPENADNKFCQYCAYAKRCKED